MTVVPSPLSHADLIETIRFDPVEGLIDLRRHLARLRASAEALNVAFDYHSIVNELQAASFRHRAPARVRLRLSPGGALAIEVSPLPATPPEALVALAALPVPPGDLRLRHKTSDRAFYDDARRASGRFELLFVHPDGMLTEGSFSTLFATAGDGRLVTPPLARGLLPGVLRARMLAAHSVIERDVYPADLARPFFIGNALRGLIPARLA